MQRMVNTDSSFNIFFFVSYLDLLHINLKFTWSLTQCTIYTCTCKCMYLSSKCWVHHTSGTYIGQLWLNIYKLKCIHFCVVSFIFEFEPMNFIIIKKMTITLSKKWQYSLGIVKRSNILHHLKLRYTHSSRSMIWIFGIWIKQVKMHPIKIRKKLISETNFDIKLHVALELFHQLFPRPRSFLIHLLHWKKI